MGALAVRIGTHAAPVDRIVDGVRLRHLPGQVSLGRRSATVSGPIEPTRELTAMVRSCLAGHPLGLTVLKTRPVLGAAPVHRGGDRFERASVDVAVGPNANLVLMDVPGLWSWASATCVFPDDGAEVRHRLAGVDLRSAGREVPSLLYETPDHPTSVQVEVTTRCNLACGYCTNRVLPQREDHSVEAVLGVFDRVDFGAVDNVDFTGLGEATLHRDLPALVSEVRRRGAPSDVRLVTNGTAIPPRVFEPLCEAGVTSIAFSIDSLDEARFARARGGARLAPVLRNLEALARARTEREWGVALKIKAVLVDDAFDDANRLLEYSARLGIEMPQFSTLDRRSSAEEFYAAESFDADDGGLTSDESGAFALWVLARWQELGGRPDPPRPRPTEVERRHGYRHPGLAPADLCRWAVDAAFLTGDGAALSCCEQMMDVPRRIFGQVGERTLRDLWGAELLWGYRLPLALGVVPEGCVGCAYAPRHAAD